MGIDFNTSYQVFRADETVTFIKMLYRSLMKSRRDCVQENILHWIQVSFEEADTLVLISIDYDIKCLSDITISWKN